MTIDCDCLVCTAYLLGIEAGLSIGDGADRERRLEQRRRRERTEWPA